MFGRKRKKRESIPVRSGTIYDKLETFNGMPIIEKFKGGMSVVFHCFDGDDVVVMLPPEYVVTKDNWKDFVVAEKEADPC